MEEWYPLANSEIIYLPQLAIALAIGLYAIRAVAGDPRRFWPLLIVLTVATPGVMIYRFDFVDTFFVACLMFGACIRLVLKSDQSTGHSSQSVLGLHRIVFTLTVLYMLVEAARGMVDLESLRKIRWVVFYAMLALLPVLLSLRSHALPSLSRMALLIGVSTAVYFSAYVLYGFSSEQFRGIGRYALQTAEWGSSAQVMFPITLAMPASIVLLRDPRRWHAIAGWCAIVAALTASFYYESRSGQLTIAAFLLVGGAHLGLKRAALSVATVAVILIAFLQFVWPKDDQRDLSYVFNDVFTSTAGVFSPTTEKTRDLDRVVYVKVAFEAISADWTTFLFGYGFRAHSRVIGPYVADLLRHYGSAREDIGGDPYNVGTEALTALTVDTGVVGLALLLSNFGLVAYQIAVGCRNRYRSMWLLSLAAVLGWLSVIYILQFVLLYLAIMPNGLLTRLSLAPEEAARVAPSRAPVRLRRQWGSELATRLGTTSK